MTTSRIIEIREYDPLLLNLRDILSDGEIVIDEETESKGYLDISIRGRQVQIRSTKFVGLIPFNDRLSVRVLPRANIANLTRIIVKSGNIPAILPNFHRGYRPQFEVTSRPEETYHKSFMNAVSKVVQRGFLREYVSVKNPIAWRGRLMVAQTINRYRSRGIRYSAAFDHTTLSPKIVENIIIKEGVRRIVRWLERQPRKFPELREARILESAFHSVPAWNGSIGQLIGNVMHRANTMPIYYGYYREALWTAYALLQSGIPDINSDGFLSLDSMIVNMSEAFEGYVRELIADGLSNADILIVDGNARPSGLFVDAGGFQIKPDIVVERSGATLGVLDAKYKIAPKESDRYEVLSYLDAMNASRGAFICPSTTPNDQSQYLGRTTSGKELAVIRIDLAATDLQTEERKFVRNAQRFISGNYAFE